MGQLCQTVVKFIAALMKLRSSLPFGMAHKYKLVPVPGYPEEFTFSTDLLPVKKHNSAFKIRKKLSQLKDQEPRNSKVVHVSTRPRNFFSDVSGDCIPSPENANFRYPRFESDYENDFSAWDPD